MLIIVAIVGLVLYYASKQGTTSSVSPPVLGVTSVPTIIQSPVQLPPIVQAPITQQVISQQTLGAVETSVIQNSNGTITTVTTTPSLVQPYLKPGAVLMSDNTIATMAYPPGGGISKTSFTSQAITCIDAEQLVIPSIVQQCSGGGHYQGTPLALTTLKSGSLALGTATQLAAATGQGAIGSLAGIGSTGFGAAGTAAATAVPIIGIAIGAAISILSTITAHHAAAVKNEQSLECQLVPSANQALSIIETAVATGNITPAQGQSALNTLLTDFRTQASNGASGQLHEAKGACNAMCWILYLLKAVIIKKQNRYSQFLG